MKVLVIGLDGLEYGLVEKFGCETIKQVEYGKVTIPKECYIRTSILKNGKFIYEPFTPFVWSSFLTGRLPMEYGFTKLKLEKWDNSLIERLKMQLAKTWLNKIKGKGKFLRLLGFKKHTFNITDYTTSTFVHSAKKPVTINFPTVNKEWGIKLPSSNFDEAVRLQWKKFLEIEDKTLKTFSNSWDLFMTYTKLLDVIGELYYKYWSELRKAYLACDNFVKRVLNRLSDRTICLIISDHGIEQFGETDYGKHSDYGFYSLNNQFNLTNPCITDFYDLICGWLKGC